MEKTTAVEVNDYRVVVKEVKNFSSTLEVGDQVKVISKSAWGYDIQEIESGEIFHECGWDIFDPVGNIIEGFVANELDGEDVMTALFAQFYNGYTTIPLDQIDEKVVGKDLLMHANLHALIDHKDSLAKNNKVDVHLEWSLSEDRRSFVYVRVKEVQCLDSEV